MNQTLQKQLERYRNHIDPLVGEDGDYIGYIYYHDHIDPALFEAATNTTFTVEVDPSKIEHVWLRHVPVHNRQFDTMLYPATPHTRGAFKATQLIE